MPDENQDNKPNPAEAFQNLLTKNNNDALKLASQLFDENFQLRRDKRELKNTQPKDGAIILSPEEKNRLDEADAFLAEVKLDFNQTKERLGKVSELETENQKLVKRDSYRNVEKLGYDLDVLEEQLAKFPEATLTTKKIKDEKDASKEREVPFVSLDGKESSLDDFGQEKFPKYLTALKQGEAQQQIQKPGNPPPPAVYGGGDSLFDRIRKNAEEKKKNSPQTVSLKEIAARVY